MSARVAGDVTALAAVPGAAELSLDGLVRAGLELEACLEDYWARCPDFRPRWQRLGPDLVGHAGRARLLGLQFGRVARQLATAGAVAPLEPIWLPRRDAMADLAAADAAALDRMRLLERAAAVAPALAGTRLEALAAALSAAFVHAGNGMLWRYVERADGQVEVTLLDRRQAGLSMGGEASAKGFSVGLSVQLLLGRGQGWTKRFASRDEAERFVSSTRARSLVEKAASDAGWMFASLAGVGILYEAAASKFLDRGFDEPIRTTEVVRADVAISGEASVGEAGYEAGAGSTASLSVTRDHEHGTVTDTLALGFDAAHGPTGPLAALWPTEGPARARAGSGEAALEVTRDGDGRALELRLTTVTSADGGDTLERAVHSLDLTAPSHRPVADALSTGSKDPAARVDELVKGAALAGAGMGTSHTWSVVVRETYERRSERGVEFDQGLGPSLSATAEEYRVTHRSVS